MRLFCPLLLLPLAACPPSSDAPGATIPSPARPPGPPLTLRLEDLDWPRIEAACKAAVRIPAEGYQGLISDTHVHTSPMEDQTEFVVELLLEMNQMGVDRVAVQPNHGIGAGPKAMRPLEAIWGEISLRCPRILTFAYAFDPDAEDARAYALAAIDSRRFAGIGEIEFLHSKMDLSADPLSANMQAIYERLATAGKPVHFQAAIDRDRSLEAKMRTVATTWPRLNMLWFGCTKPEAYRDLGNVYFNIFVYEEAWRPTAELVPHSVLGTDSTPGGFWNPGSRALPFKNFADAIARARRALAHLPAEQADAIAHTNFDRLFPRR